MMQAMRDRVKVIYWIVVVSFIGLMFLGWGLGGGFQTQRAGVDNGVVATVDGVDIKRVDWEQRAAAILRQMQAQRGENATVGESELLRARDQAFAELVSETLQDLEAKRRGLKVTDEEVHDILQNDPPPALLAEFTDEQGNVDYDAYYAALNSPTTDWRMLTSTLKERLPRQKLLQQVAGAALVGEGELREAYNDQYARAVAEWVGVNFSDVTLDDDTVTDAEAQAYYEEHLDEYKQPARATVRLVEFPKVASEEDEQEILSILSEIRTDIIEGRLEFEDAARTYSEDGSAASGGDLGFFDRNRMVAPFTEAAFALAVGDISEPVRTQFGYHLIECTDEKLDDKGERTEIRARHILLKLHPSQSTLDVLRDQAYDVHEKASSDGLDAAATEAGVEVTETAPFQEGFNIPGVANSLPGARFAFDNDTGKLSPVFENDDAIYFFEVAEKLPAGHRSLDEVRTIVESEILRERRADKAAAKLAEAMQGVGPDDDFAAIAKKAGLAHGVTDTFSLRENIDQIGFATSFARVALAMNEGEMNREVRTNRGVYALKVLYKSPFDEEDYRAKRPQLLNMVLQTRQRMLMQDWMIDQQEKAEIDDRRSEFL